MKVVRAIDCENKSVLYCRLVEFKDKKMIKSALKKDNECVKALMRFRRCLEIFVGYGTLSVDEGVELHRCLSKAIDVVKQRNAKDIAERVADLSIQRIARKIGGKVVAEDEQ